MARFAPFARSEFPIAPTYAAGYQPESIAAGDFNGDGNIDLAVANYCAYTNCLPRTPGGVAILLGSGDGSFQPAVAYNVENDPRSVQVADLNGDGKLDLVIANFCGTAVPSCTFPPVAQGSVSVLLGNGDGTFQPQVAYPVGHEANALIVGDFNGDRVPDLAVANICGQDVNCQSGGTVSILLGNGNGSFRPAVDYNAGPNPWNLAAGDFNHDGTVDVAVVNPCGHYFVCGNESTSTISILPGNGDGTFRPYVKVTAEYDSTAIAVADLNGDGNLDLVVANECVLEVTCYEVGYGYKGNLSGEGTVSIFLGIGNGSFRPPSDYPTGGGPNFVVIADVNGDGKPDVVTSNYGETASVLVGNGDGTFNVHVDYGGGESPVGVTVGDFNGDHEADIAVADMGFFDAGSVALLTNNGNGTFHARLDNPASDQPDFTAVADFNGDGIPDIAASSGGKNLVNILLGKGNDTFQNLKTYVTGHGPVSITVADFNRDGKLDLATADICGNAFCNGPGTMSVLLGNGNGTFGPHTQYPAGNLPANVTTGDFNGDGFPDVVVCNLVDNMIGIYLNRGDGTFNAANEIFAGNSPIHAATGDFNRDGKTDLAVANSGSETISILLGNGDGTFQAPVSYPAGDISVTVGDLNRDGKQDLVTGADSGGLIKVLLGKGDGTFQPYLQYGSPACVGGYTGLGDFNGDGKLDVVVQTGCDTASVLLGNGDGSFQTNTDYPVGILAATVSVLGNTEIVVPNIDSSTISVLPNLGVTRTMLTSSPNPSKAGQQVTFTAKVVPNVQGGQGTPTGKVTFKSGSTKITVNLVKGVAQFTTSQLKAGTYKFTATYLGDGFFNPSTSMTVTQIVNP